MALSDIVRETAYLQGGGQPQGQRDIDKIQAIFKTIGGIADTRNALAREALESKRKNLESLGSAGLQVNPETPQGQELIRSVSGGISPEALKQKEKIGTYENLVEVSKDMAESLGRPDLAGRKMMQGEISLLAANQRAQTVGGRAEKEFEFKSKQADISSVLKLRDDFYRDVGDFPKVRASYNNIKTLSEKEGTAAGDIGLVFNFMRMQDPASTVREGEQASAQNAAGVPERVRVLYNKILTGERLDPVTRADFKNIADSLYRASLNQTDKTIKQYEGLATKLGLDPSLIITDYSSFSDVQPTTAQGNQTAGTIDGRTGNTVMENTGAKPKKVIQNGFTYTFNEETGQYE